MRLLPIPLVLALAACSPGLPGGYDLQTMDGEALPVPFFDDQITAIRLQLNADGTCQTSVSFASTESPETDDDCTWTLEDAALTVLTGDGDRLSGTVDGGVMTLTGSDGTSYDFTRS